MANRTNIPVVVKTFRLTPELVEDMEKVIYLSRKEGNRPKYRSMTAFTTAAFERLIKKERTALEAQGVAWDHINLNKQENDRGRTTR